MHYGINRYNKAEITYGDPITAVISAYDIMIRLLIRIKRYAQEKDIGNLYQATRKTVEIVNILESELDLANGGDFADKLQKFYSCIRSELCMINMKNAEEESDKIIGYIKIVKQKWQDILHQTCVSDEDDTDSVLQDLQHMRC